MRRLVGHRDARVLLLGESLSLFGDRAMFLALGIWVKELTGSNAAAGLVFFALALPYLAAPLGGLLVDRVRRRPLMISVEVALAAILLSLFLVHGRAQLWLIYAVTACYGAAGVVFGSARSALLTVLLPEDLLADANAALQTVGESMRLVAPLAGAGLFTLLGGAGVAAIDAGTFLFSALCLALLRVVEPPPAPREHHWLRELGAGLAHVRRTPLLRRIILSVAGAVLVIGFAETLVFAVVDQGLHRPPSFLGILLSCQGIGAIAGGLTAAPLLRRLGDARLVALGLALFAIGEGFFVFHSVALVVLGIVIAGVGVPWAIVAFATAIQLRSPAHLQGRVYSAADMTLSLPQTISLALGAALSTLVDYRILVLAMSAAIVACAAPLARAPREGAGGRARGGVGADEPGDPALAVALSGAGGATAARADSTGCRAASRSPGRPRTDRPR
jgi:MFS family permease